MPAVLPCPDAALLNELLAGKLADPQGEALARHLEECSRCVEEVRKLPPQDVLAEAARSGANSPDGPETPFVRGLVERLRQLPALPQQYATGGDANAVPPEPGEDGASDALGCLAPAETPDEIGRLGPYRVLQVLGAGGMGVVFGAEDTRLGRQLALKVMNPRAAAKPAGRERFLREARAAAAIEHENIVTIYQVGEENGVPFLAMQWLKGMSLEERLRRPGLLSVPQVLRVGRQVARGLAAAHACGLIHRDIKPANLWLEPEHGDHVKILDFGLARPVQGDGHLTQSGTIVGTPAYMAPEQARGEPIDGRCDLFSLGCVLYRLTTGELPFQGNDTLGTLWALALNDPRPVRDLNPAVPPALADLVMQLLAKDPARRPGSAAEVARRLAELEDEPTAPLPAPSAPLAPPVQPAEPSSPQADIDRTAPESRPPLPGGRRPGLRDRRRWQSFGRRALVAVVAVLAALLPLGYFFGGTVIRIVTNKGELVVEPDDPTVEVVVKMNGEVVQVRTTNREFTLTAGDGQVEVYEKDGIKLATKKFTLTRGGKETVRVTAQELADVRKLKLPGPQRALVFRGGLRGSAQPENLVTYQGVQQELHMTPQQILRANAVVRQMSNKHAGLFLTLRGYRDERASVDKGIAVHKTAAEETLKALAGVLEPEQVKRLKQIHLQEMAVFAFLDLDIQNALKVSDEQKDKIRTLAADTVANERDAYDHARGGNPERQVKADMIRKDSREKAEAILNDGQKKTWKEMIGEAVEIQVGREQVLLRRRRAGPVDDTWDPIEMGKGLAPAVEAGSRPPLPKR